MRRKTYERNRGFTSGVTLTGRRKPMSMSIKVEDGKTIQVSRKGELKFKSNFGDHKVGFLFHTYYENGEKTFDDLEWTYGELNKLGKTNYYKAHDRITKLCQELEKRSENAKQGDNK